MAKMASRGVESSKAWAGAFRVADPSRLAEAGHRVSLLPKTRSNCHMLAFDGSGISPEFGNCFTVLVGNRNIINRISPLPVPFFCYRCQAVAEVRWRDI